MTPKKDDSTAVTQHTAIIGNASQGHAFMELPCANDPIILG